jgi:hypothetical protein
MFCPWMRLVQVPCKQQLTQSQTEDVTLQMSSEHKVETVVLSPGDSTYVRLSANIYNEVSDYEKLKLLPDILNKL